MDALHAQALQARAAGEHERAIGLWRALLRQRPDDWRLALELKRDLKAALHYPDSDPQFRRAARFLPDTEWLAHYAALYSYHGEDLATLDARARAMLERAPGSVLLLAIIGEVASQRQRLGGIGGRVRSGVCGRAQWRIRLEARRRRHVSPAGAAP